MRYLNVPPALMGLADEPPPGFEDKPKIYVKDFTLLANGTATDTVDIDMDSDFVWRAITFTSTGNFSVQFTDSTGFAFSNAKVASSNLSPDPANPTALEVEQIIPRRGKLKIEILDTSGAGNTVQLAFWGVQRLPQ